MQKQFVFKCDCLGEYQDCHCDHNSVIWVDKEENEVLVHTSLRHYQSFFKRLVVGIKYILGIDNTYVTHTDTLMTLDAFNSKIKEVTDYIKCTED